MKPSSAPEILLQLTNIYKSYRMGPVLVPVLRDVNLSISSGEFVAIMGASGSGKSTLLHIAGLLDHPDPFTTNPSADDVLTYQSPRKGFAQFGDVIFRGQPASRLGIWQKHRLRNHQIGFVFQFYHLLPELNVLENVLLPAMIDAPMLNALLGIRPRREEALALIDSFGLTSRIKHRPAQLSGGERQRVAIARALINQPALLLADEPTGNLDAKTGRAILDVLVKLHREKSQTILLVTHDPNVAKLADRTVHLSEGRIKTRGVSEG
jgi:lipoprotein-releasing system ATP-binding protein